MSDGCFWRSLLSQDTEGNCEGEKHRGALCTRESHWRDPHEEEVKHAHTENSELAIGRGVH